MLTDPIADMLTRVRNASKVRKPEARLPFSKIKFAIAKILEQEGYFEKIERLDASEKGGSLRLVLKYTKEKKPVISGIKRISKPGQRIYVSKYNLPDVLSGYGMAVVSTSKGLMTNKDAKKQGLGGEIICEIW